MNYAQWRAKSELILNQMEHVPYKSTAYLALKEELENHLRNKPPEEDETEDLEWVMSGPSPLGSDSDPVGSAGDAHVDGLPQAKDPSPSRKRMILHHIKPDQLSTLEVMFGKVTKSGFEIPLWLLHLKETVKTPATPTDFEPTAPDEAGPH